MTEQRLEEMDARLRALEDRAARDEMVAEIMDLADLLGHPLYSDMRRWTLPRLKDERDMLRRIIALRQDYSRRKSA